ncbi:MAG: histidine phosphatase family protein [Actinomycetota bacterium]
MEIVFVRHAEPEWVKDKLNIDNPPLTERGFVQAQLLGQWAKNEHFDEVFVSPLVRTRQTAVPILETLSKDLQIAPWLEEIRNPIWHGTPEEKAIEAYKTEKSKKSHERWGGLDGGEPVRDFVQRINIGASLFLEEHGLVRADTELPIWNKTSAFRADVRILLVAHAGTSSVSICHMLGFPPTPWEWERLVIGHATVNRLEVFEIGDGMTFGLTQLSGNEHLPVDLRTY